MKIFVGYGYNPRDAWIEDLVFKLINAFGDEVVSGKEIFGQDLDDGVRGEIKRSNALIGFTTRRDPIGAGQTWTTHQWVRDELLTAAQAQPTIPLVEVRETAVESQGGMLANRAHIRYDEQQRERCLIELAQTLGQWHRQWASTAANTVQFVLMPEEFSREIGPVIRNPNLRCNYYVLGKNDTDPSAARSAALLRLKGRQLAIRTGAVPEDASIMVEVWQGAAMLWNSDWEPVDSRAIHLEKATS